MKKKITALSLCFIMLFTFCSCGKSDTVMKVSGNEIPAGIFAYYLNEVMSAPEKYGVKEVLTYYTGAVIGSHTGPGLFLAAFFRKS